MMSNATGTRLSRPTHPIATALSHHLSDRAAAMLLAGVTFVILVFSSIRGAGDSRYTLVLSETLLHQGTLHLDRYFRAETGDSAWEPSYHVVEAHGHIDYVFPAGSSLLSLPFSGLFNLFGSSVVSTDGQYRHDVELWQQHQIACVLMSALAGVMYLTARTAFPVMPSAALAMAAVLSSQIWSVASRSLWSHTWGILLLGWALLLVTRCEMSQRKNTVRPVVLATLLSWSFFCRPTFAISIVGVTAWMMLRRRGQFPLYAVTGGLWFCGFLVFSQFHYGQPLPWYFAPGRISTGPMSEALLGNLISPARGILIYTPVLGFVAWLALRDARRSQLRWVCLIGAACVVAHYITVSGFGHWWAGHSYGPRLMTDIVPWWFVIAIAAADGWQRSESAVSRRRLSPQWLIGCGLLGVSIVLNGAGALSSTVYQWSSRPTDVDLHPERLWDWSDPPFLRSPESL